LDDLVAEGDARQQRGGGVVEQGGVEAGELKVELGRGWVVTGAGRVVESELLLGGFGVVAVVDEVEEQVQRILEVGPVAGGIGVEVDEAELAEPVDGVAGEVGVVVDGEDAELGARFRVEQDDKAVEPAEALPGEFSGVDAVGTGVDGATCGEAALDKFVGEEFDALPDPVAQVLRNPNGVFVGRLSEGVEDRWAAVVVTGEVPRNESVGGEEAGDRFDLTALAGVHSLEGGVEIDGEEPAFGPLGSFGEYDDPPAAHEDVAGWLVCGEDLADSIGRVGDGPLVGVTPDRVEEDAGGVGIVAVVEEVVGVLGESGVEGHDEEAGAGLNCRGDWDVHDVDRGADEFELGALGGEP
jgi:hypothetical protein